MSFLRSNRSEELQGVLSGEHSLPSDDEVHVSRRQRSNSNFDLEATLHPDDDDANRSSSRVLSTFSGVFCPVALSQFSTLLFLRMGFVIGQSGLIQFSIELVLAYSILLLTILSICAISTNGEISGGGVYFMISRTLGPEFGGSIGLLFFLANIFACGLYVSGFTEGLVDNFGPHGNLAKLLPGATLWWKYLYSLLVLVLCLCVCLVGGSLFARTSVFILLILLVCFGSVLSSLLFHEPIEVAVPRSNHLIYNAKDNATLNTNYTVYFNFTGPRLQTLIANALPHYNPDYSIAASDPTNMTFTRVFAILFSSVTGIMNGANLSGELKKPSESIPLGTLLGTLFTFVCYLLLGLVIGCSCQYELLINNYSFLIPINFWPPFVVIGIAAATLSAALGNLIGASRILAALAKDGIFGLPLKPAAITTKSGNPIPAVLISFVLVLIVLKIGSLNTIAPIVSCFFLLSYASTNLACAALDLAAATNFRPSFKLFHWGSSLAGLVGSVVMSFLVSLIYTPVSVMLLLVLIICLHFRDLPDSWGSITQALIFHQVRKYLLMLDLRKSHVKYWRPQILLLVANPRASANTIEFVNDLKKGGLFVLGHVRIGDFESESDGQLPERSEADEVTDWLAIVDCLKVKAFVELTMAPTVRAGMHHLVRISGLGGMKPNTVCIGFYDDADPINTLAFKQMQSSAAAVATEVAAVAAAAATAAETSESAAAAAAAADISSLKLPAIRSGSGSEGNSSDRDIRSRQEFVQMLRDVLRLNKNLLITRHMQHAANPQQLHDSPSIVGRLLRNQRVNIDVWPVNFFQPQLTGVIDTTCLLQLQFACILHTVKTWKWRSQLRVFLCVDASSRVSELTTRLSALLADLRIQAQTHLLDWQHVLGELHSSDSSAAAAAPGAARVSEPYLRAVNQAIRLQSPATAATFMYLPSIPTLPSEQEEYMDNVELLTRDLPPTILVHGQQSVVSRNL